MPAQGHPDSAVNVTDNPGATNSADAHASTRIPPARRAKLLLLDLAAKTCRYLEPPPDDVINMAESDPKTSQLFHEQYFPTSIFYTDLAESAALNLELVRHIYAWKSEDPEGIVRSNFKQAGSWHSQLDMHEKPQFSALTDQIIKAAVEVFSGMNYDMDFAPVIDNMWANINPRYGYNRSHSHPDTLWSGVYYIQAPENCGRISFNDPRSQAQVYTPRMGANANTDSSSWSEVYYGPIPGRLILFPGWLVHEVEPNLSTLEGDAGNRISVSFNIYQSSTRSG
ncbi:hypothetical protein AB833_01125 [Chromatiales bacterium (ex Bugula neritina AB1)]|nr:hypothetical protein AB833_01125 [Chromatiales bacterium (ex Bugula neritina AB1)]